MPLGTSTQALILAEQLRARGVRVDLAYGDKSLKGGMKAADKSGARFSIVLGDEEFKNQEVSLKEMSTGEVQSVTLSALANRLVELTATFGEHS